MKNMTATANNFKRAIGFFKKYSHFFISAHVNPEGDSLGSQLAVAQLLRPMGKTCEIINSDVASREYAFLPQIQLLQKKPRNKKFDAAIILDCSDLSRIGNARGHLPKGLPILNIDHHISNTYFGTVNLVIPGASSTCEIIFKLLCHMRAKITKQIATCLYTGILVDTGSFRYSNTTSEVHMIVAKLLGYGLKADVIFRHVFENIALPELQLIQDAVRTIQMDTTGKIAWVVITQAMINRYKPQIDFTDKILTMLRSIHGVEVCALFKEGVGKQPRIRINLRSRGLIDVNAIARCFGGGGHKTASGITIRGASLAGAQKKIIRSLQGALRRKR